MKITEEHFTTAVGREPRIDDLARSNCPKAGQIGHFQCGWNHQKNLPVFMAGPEIKEPTT